MAALDRDDGHPSDLVDTTDFVSTRAPAPSRLAGGSSTRGGREAGEAQNLDAAREPGESTSTPAPTSDGYQ